MARAHGIDISKWQTSFDAAKNPNDIQFVVMRASVGIMTDSRFDEMYNSIQPIPVRAAYHYFRSEWGWQEQAAHFLSLVKDRNFHFFALDLESADNKRSAQFCRDAKRWIDHVAQQTGKRVLLYTNLVIYNTWLKPHGDWMKDYPLWIAQYWFEPDRNKKPALPDGVTEWTFWQYSADGNNMGAAYGVGSKHLDLDVFNGPVEDLYKWASVKKAAKPAGPASVVKPDEELGQLPAGIDYDLLARKVAPLVADLLRTAPSTLRPVSPGGTSFGFSMVPDEPAGLEEVSGIGPAFAGRLAEHGVRNCRALAFLGADEVSQILDISLARAEGFIAEARLLEGV
jgi:GH25 family lysozyme M1 (1,4-beta-N-acetylmuramidase)